MNLSFFSAHLSSVIVTSFPQNITLYSLRKEKGRKKKQKKKKTR